MAIRPSLGGGALLLALAISAAATGPLTSAAPTPPTAGPPVGDVVLYSGSTVDGAVDLSAHFESTDGSGLAFTVAGADPGAGDADGKIVLRVRGNALDVLAPNTSWAGNASYRVEACAGTGAGAACTAGAPFEVRVLAPPAAHVAADPTGYAIEGAFDAAQAREGERLHVDLKVPANADVRAAPAWYLDGQPIGTGEAVQTPAVSAGVHELSVRLETGKGPAFVTRQFAAAAAPALPQGGASAFVFVALASAAAGVAVLSESARVRRPLVLFLIGSIYSRLRTESLLDHFRRGALYQIILENPGIHFSELRRRTGISHGSAIHHLRALEQGSYLRVETKGALTRYFVTGAPLEDDSYGLNARDLAVLRSVVERPGISQAELSAHLSTSGGTISRSVARLTALGYVKTGRATRRKLVYPREGRALPPALEADKAGEAGP